MSPPILELWRACSLSLLFRDPIYQNHNIESMWLRRTSTICRVSGFKRTAERTARTIVFTWIY